MRRATMGITFLAGLMVGALAFTRAGTTVLAQPVGVKSNSMTMSGVPLANGGQQVVVMDAESKVIACYHADSDGAIELKSVRNIRWDLQLEVFNGGELKPEDIRALIQK